MRFRAEFKVNQPGTPVAQPLDMFSEGDRARDGSPVLALLTELSKHRREAQNREGTAHSEDDSSAPPPQQQGWVAR